MARAGIGVWEEKSSRLEERSAAEVDFWTFAMISMARKRTGVGTHGDEVGSTRAGPGFPHEVDECCGVTGTLALRLLYGPPDALNW